MGGVRKDLQNDVKRNIKIAQKRAAELCYPKRVIERLAQCKTNTEITNILIDARCGKI